MSPWLQIVNAYNRNRVKYWEIIADNLSKAGWSWGCVSAVDSHGRTSFVADAHRDDGKRSRSLILSGSGLLRMPRLRHVLDPRLASVTDQNEGQSISVWAAELIHTGSSASFWDRSNMAGLLNCDRIVRDRIVAPDFSFWPNRHDVKRAVSIDCPHSAERIGPCARESSWTGCHGRTGTQKREQSGCDNDSKRSLQFHGGILPCCG